MRYSWIFLMMILMACSNTRFAEVSADVLALSIGEESVSYTILATEVGESGCDARSVKVVVKLIHSDGGEVLSNEHLIGTVKSEKSVQKDFEVFIGTRKIINAEVANIEFKEFCSGG